MQLDLIMFLGILHKHGNLYDHSWGHSQAIKRTEIYLFIVHTLMLFQVRSGLVGSIRAVLLKNFAKPIAISNH